MQQSSYDDTRLRQLFADLEPKRRRQALRGAFTRAARTVKSAAVANLRGVLNSNAALERGIRTVVMRRALGFQVTIGSKRMSYRNKGKRNGRTRRASRGRMAWTDMAMHRNRAGLDKPVLIWAEAGTRWRRTRKRTAVPVGQGMWRTSRIRGYMKAGRFMERAGAQTEGTVTATLRQEIAESVIRTAKKYGCS